MPGTYNPPKYSEYAKRARYMMHHINWGSLSTISTLEEIKGQPFGNIISVVDGTKDKSTGVPYFYVMDADQSMKDIAKNNSVSLSLSEAEVCPDTVDPEFPTIGRLSMCGKFRKETDPEKITFAKEGLFQRFPDMKLFPVNHGFYVAHLEIELIWLLDSFGPAKEVKLKDYFEVQL